MVTFTNLALALHPNEILSDPDLEKRARNLGEELRCLVCQNQSIDDSDAELARDLRIIVRQQLSEGKSDKDIKDYLIQRYGYYILLTPPFNRYTYLLWGSPLLFLVLAILIYHYYFQQSQKQKNILESSLTEKEKEILEKTKV
jgi:cytochrome c-type biogenesis protein CcmH